MDDGSLQDADHSELTVNGEIGGDYDFSVIESGAYVRMLELSAEKQPEFGKSMSFKSDYRPLYGSSFTLTVQVNGKTLDDVVAAGMKIVDEIFKPIREAEKFVEDKLEELKASQKELIRSRKNARASSKAQFTDPTISLHGIVYRRRKPKAPTVFMKGKLQ